MVWVLAIVRSFKMPAVLVFLLVNRNTIVLMMLTMVFALTVVLPYRIEDVLVKIESVVLKLFLQHPDQRQP